MKKENLVKRLGKKFLPCLLAGALAFSTYRCANEFVESEPKKPVEKPVAVLAAEPTEGYAPLEVYLNGEESSCDPSCSITEYRFDFNNDGIIDKVSEQPGIYNTYEEARIYQTSLEVLDSRGQVSDKDLETIVVKFVESKKPIAILTADPTEGTVPLRVYLNGEESSCDPSCSIIEYHFDFDGDGNTDRVSEYPWVYYTYENAGTYKLTLFVKDSKGQKSDKALETIVVNENIVTLGRIAFWSDKDAGTGELYTGEIIYRVKDDKTELRDIKRLTNNENNDIKPSYSPDGSQIVWSANRPTPDGWFALYVVDPNQTDGDDEIRITPFIDGFDILKSIWCNNGKIYSNFWDHNLNTQGIARIDPNGTGFPEKIIEEPVSGLSGCPACSSDGSQIAFATSRDGNWEIYIANSDGTNPYNFTNTPNEDEDQPVWAPDGNGIFFRKGEIYYQDLGSNIPEQITFGIGALDPAISSDGNKLLFIGQIGWYNIYMQELSSGNLTKLTSSETPSDSAYRYPAWKPKIED